MAFVDTKVPDLRNIFKGVKEPDLRGIFNRPDLLDDAFGERYPAPIRGTPDFDPVTPEERERIRILEGRGPFPTTEGLDPFSPNPFKNMRLDYLYKYMNDRGLTEQNQEVMGSKEQVFPRYANPEDGTLNNKEMARVDPTDKLLLDSLRKGEIGPLTDPRIRKAIVDLERKIYNDGRASSMDGALMAADPVDRAAHGPAMTRSQFSDYNELRSPGYKDRRDALRMRLINAGILPRV